MKKNIRFSFIIIMLSIALFCCYHIYYYFYNENSNILMEKYFVETKENSENERRIVNKITNHEEYFGILTIPKINLKTGFYNKNSNNNHVNHSVTILDESILPEKDGSIVYLAAHSGDGYLAYFKNLNQLTNEDFIELSINKKKYQYSVFDIYEIPKTGNITVNHNIHEKCLVLTTCSNNKNMQLVILAKMISKV